MRHLLSALAGLLMAGTATTVHAIDIYNVKDYPTAIEIRGSFEDGDEDYLKQVVLDRAGKGVVTEFVLLDSGGGQMKSAFLISRAVRRLEITTVIGDQAECASACVMVFAAGTDRHLWAGGRIGVHNASTADGSAADRATVGSAQELADYGVPASVVGKLVVTPPGLDHMANRAGHGGLGHHYPARPPMPARRIRKPG